LKQEGKDPCVGVDRIRCWDEEPLECARPRTTATRFSKSPADASVKVFVIDG
jgi:hypothetical protein